MKKDTPVSEIMSKNVQTITPAQKLVDVKHLFEKTPFHHHLPVVEENKLVGMLSLVDFMRAISYATLDDDEPVYQQKTVKEVMSLNPVQVSASATVHSVATMLAKGEVHAVVVADNGVVKGIVSYSDVINHCLKTCE